MNVTGASAVEVYYDPFDFAIDDNPYPTWKRMRDEALALPQREVQLLRAEPL